MGSQPPDREAGKTMGTEALSGTEPPKGLSINPFNLVGHGILTVAESAKAGGEKVASAGTYVYSKTKDAAVTVWDKGKDITVKSGEGVKTIAGKTRSGFATIGNALASVCSQTHW